jgi:hypothetical protein
MYPRMEALGQGCQGGLSTRIGGGDENTAGTNSVSTPSSNHCNSSIISCGSLHCRTDEFSLWSQEPFLSKIKIERAGKSRAVLKWADSHLSPPFQSWNPKALSVLTSRASSKSGTDLVIQQIHYQKQTNGGWYMNPRDKKEEPEEDEDEKEKRKRGYSGGVPG